MMEQAPIGGAVMANGWTKCDNPFCGMYGVNHSHPAELYAEEMATHTTSEIEAKKADRLVTCEDLGHHDFPNQVVFKRRTGLDESHCSRCGLLFSEFKQQVRAVTL